MHRVHKTTLFAHRRVSLFPCFKIGRAQMVIYCYNRPYVLWLADWSRANQNTPKFIFWSISMATVWKGVEQYLFQSWSTNQNTLFLNFMLLLPRQQLVLSKFGNLLCWLITPDYKRNGHHSTGNCQHNNLFVFTKLLSLSQTSSSLFLFKTFSSL